jgi:hypothetical protein
MPHSYFARISHSLDVSQEIRLSARSATADPSSS